MARNPYFPVGRKMCLMGDIKERVYYSSLDNVHVSICTIRILVYAFYEPLDCHYKRILAFEKHFASTELKTHKINRVFRD